MEIAPLAGATVAHLVLVGLIALAASPYTAPIDSSAMLTQKQHERRWCTWHIEGGDDPSLGGLCNGPLATD
jgi:hypothetical protein